MADEKRLIEQKIEQVRNALAERYEAGFRPLLRETEARHVEELLAAAAHKSKSELRQLLAERFPAPDVPAIVVDNYAGALMATNHLIGLGHRQIAHIAGPELFLSSRERERGFRQAMLEAGLEPFSIEPGQFQISSGLEAADRWISAGRLPTAVFAADDYTALGMMDALKTAGIRIPQDVSVVGFDDQIIASQFRPKLTTVRQPAEEIGRRAVEQIGRAHV